MAIDLPFRLILASGSLGRRELLRQAGYSFDIRPANIDEPTQTAFGDIRHYVHDVAWRKAAAVAPGVAEGIVLTADTVGWLDGSVIGKAEDEADARRILTMLGGKVHELWTGVCLWLRPTDWQWCWQERSLVRMRPMTSAELDAYLATRQWQGCSGAYAIRDHDDPYLEVVEGSLTNVIGLPMESLAAIFARLEQLR